MVQTYDMARGDSAAPILRETHDTRCERPSPGGRPQLGKRSLHDCIQAKPCRDPALTIGPPGRYLRPGGLAFPG